MKIWDVGRSVWVLFAPRVLVRQAWDSIIDAAIHAVSILISHTNRSIRKVDPTVFCFGFDCGPPDREPLKWDPVIGFGLAHWWVHSEYGLCVDKQVWRNHRWVWIWSCGVWIENSFFYFLGFCETLKAEVAWFRILEYE